MGHSEDRIHGGADLMAHVGKEVGLRLGGGHGLFFGCDEIRFGALTIGDVFGRVEEILRISSSVPDHRKSAICNDEAAIGQNKVLFPLVVVELAFEEFLVAFCTGGTLIGVDYLV